MPTKLQSFCCSDFENMEDIFKAKTSHCRNSGSLGASLFNKFTDSKRVGRINLYTLFFKGQVKMFPKIIVIKVYNVTWFL